MNISDATMIDFAMYVLIALLLGILFMMFFTFIIKKKDPNKFVKELNEKISSQENAPDLGFSDLSLPNKKHKIKKIAEAETPEKSDLIKGHEILNIDRIFNDMIIGNKNSNICSMVIECKGINYSLMSENEKFEIERTFVDFINTLEIPIQIFIKTRTRNYLHTSENCEKKMQEMENDLSALLDKLTEVEDSETASGQELKSILIKIKNKQKIYDYMKALKSQMTLISNNFAILQNDYYIVINYFSYCETEKVNLKDDRSLELIKTDLTQKCNNIINSVKKCGVESSILDSYQLCELFATSFLCEGEKIQKIKDVIRSGFFKMYPSSKR